MQAKRDVIVKLKDGGRFMYVFDEQINNIINAKSSMHTLIIFSLRYNKINDA